MLDFLNRRSNTGMTSLDDVCDVYFTVFSS
jgi:hypothetical protein